MKKIILLLLLVTILAGCVSNDYEKTVRHEIEYSVTIDLTSPKGDNKVEGEIYNATFYIPLPIKEEEAINLKNVSKPENWEVLVVETEYGKMLEIKAKRIRTEIPPMLIPVKPGETPSEFPEEIKNFKWEPNEVRFRLKLDKEVDTLNPINGEFTLSPKFNLEEIACPEDYSIHYKYVKCYEYMTKVYAKYEGGENLSVSIAVWLNGRNTWFDYGWTGNEFDDFVLVRINGSGWYDVEGKLEVGKGIYRK